MKNKGSLLLVGMVYILLLPLAMRAQNGANSTPSGEGTSSNGLDMQAARARKMSVNGKKVWYTKKFDLSGLPGSGSSRDLALAKR